MASVADSDRSIDRRLVVLEHLDKAEGLKWPAAMVDDVNAPVVYIDARGDVRAMTTGSVEGTTPISTILLTKCRYVRQHPPHGGRFDLRFLRARRCGISASLAGSLGRLVFSRPGWGHPRWRSSRTSTRRAR